MVHQRSSPESPSPESESDIILPHTYPLLLQGIQDVWGFRSVARLVRRNPHKVLYTGANPVAPPNLPLTPRKRGPCLVSRWWSMQVRLWAPFYAGVVEQQDT